MVDRSKQGASGPT